MINNANAYATNKRSKTLCFGDHKVSCFLLEKQLQQEVGELSRRVTELQQTNRPNLTQLQHLGNILQSRQAVLHWLHTSAQLRY